MFSFFYNACLFLLGFMVLPKLLWQCWHTGKYRSSLRARLGWNFPSFRPQDGEKVIWMHAVSMGEVKAMVALFHAVRSHFPNQPVIISTTTETGLAEAKRSMPGAKDHFILPLDFSWIMRRLVQSLNPSYLILCESDFWFHLLSEAKAQGAKVCLINGKMSDRSFRRFLSLSFLTRRLFSCFDVMCLQNEEYYKRFVSLGIPQDKLRMTGNLKLESIPPKKTEEELNAFRSRLGTHSSDLVLVIGSTHSPEEEEILRMLTPLLDRWPQLKILLVPRHPERFDVVAALS